MKSEREIKNKGNRKEGKTKLKRRDSSELILDRIMHKH